SRRRPQSDKCGRVPVKRSGDPSGLDFIFKLIILFSLAFYMVDLGVMTNDKYYGVFTGIFPHKNLLGRVAIIMMFFYFYRFKLSRDFTYLFLGIISLIFCIKSESSGALAIFILSLFSVFLVYRIGSALFILIYFISVCAFLYFVPYIDEILINLEWLFDLIGKDVTLTGRTILWEFSLLEVINNFWLGYGYSVYWVFGKGTMLLPYFGLNFDSPHAHNGFIDLIIDIGFVGMSLYFIYIKNLISCSINNRSNEYSAMFLFIILFLFNSNLLEKSYFFYNDIQWVLYIISSVSIKNKMVGA
ncbi:O-antigen ligase, partial [uncultured Vibrio sp.]|uniref:O-antigen ligase family protein n=1 Tax=uncultured Vibrio sp. TaxID=114054 RepID=UPI00261AD956